MANDAQWVEDVRRWYFSGNGVGRASSGPAMTEDDFAVMGYEAADPTLQARHWPDAPLAGDER